MNSNRRAFAFILTVSALAVLFLVWLIYFKQKPDSAPTLFSSLPVLNCLFNGSSAVALVMGIVAIKRKQELSHKIAMLTAFIFSALFLVSYVVYHSVHGDSLFLGEGIFRLIYFFILISHILCTIVGLPFILLTFFLALTNQFPLHKKVARWVFPIWLYMSVTGVLIYVCLKSSGSLG